MAGGLTVIVYVVFRIDFHSQHEFSGVFSSLETAQAYAARFPDEKFVIEPMPLDEP